MKKSIEKPANDSLRPFVHLHTHTEYSELDGMTKIAEMVDKAIADGMPGIAITDHANMYGAKVHLANSHSRGRGAVVSRSGRCGYLW